MSDLNELARIRAERLLKKMFPGMDVKLAPVDDPAVLKMFPLMATCSHEEPSPSKKEELDERITVPTKMDTLIEIRRLLKTTMKNYEPGSPDFKQMGRILRTVNYEVNAHVNTPLTPYGEMLDSICQAKNAVKEYMDTFTLDGEEHTKLEEYYEALDMMYNGYDLSPVEPDNSGEFDNEVFHDDEDLDPERMSHCIEYISSCVADELGANHMKKKDIKKLVDKRVKAAVKKAFKKERKILSDFLEKVIPKEAEMAVTNFWNDNIVGLEDIESCLGAQNINHDDINTHYLQTLGENKDGRMIMPVDLPKYDYTKYSVIGPSSNLTLGSYCTDYNDSRIHMGVDLWDFYVRLAPSNQRMLLSKIRKHGVINNITDVNKFICELNTPYTKSSLLKVVELFN